MAIAESDYIEAFMLAGKQLQACMDAASVSGFRWIKAQPAKPAFADLAFAIGQRIYAVILAGMTKQKTLATGEQAACTFEIPKEQCELLRSECERHRLIPAVFPLWTGIMQPLTTGWNLFSLQDMAPLDPSALPPHEQPEPMSEWELCNFRVSHVLRDLEANKRRVRSAHDIPDIYPNIWFEDAAGHPAWVAVLPAESDTIPQAVKDVRQKLPQRVHGYLARVGITHADRPGDTPMRDAPLFVNYKGLERLP